LQAGLVEHRAYTLEDIEVDSSLYLPN